MHSLKDAELTRTLALPDAGNSASSESIDLSATEQAECHFEVEIKVPALANLADAKSAYGAIVYNKAPAVLRELHARLGSDAFGRGLTQFLQQHSYGNATWRDLAASLEAAAQRDLGRWSDRWLLAPSMPQVRVTWQADAAGTVTEAAVEQRPIGGEGRDASRGLPGSR